MPCMMMMMMMTTTTMIMMMIQSYIFGKHIPMVPSVDIWTKFITLSFSKQTPDQNPQSVYLNRQLHRISSISMWYTRTDLYFPALENAVISTKTYTLMSYVVGLF